MKKYRHISHRKIFDYDRIVGFSICIIVIILVVRLLFFAVDVAGIYKGSIISSLGNTMFTKTMPVAGYVGNIEDIDDDTVLEKLINKIYPVNKYLRDSIPAGNEVEYLEESEICDTENVENIEADNLEVIRETKQSTDEQSTKEDTQANNYTDVASSKIITGTLYPRESLNDYNFVFKNFYTVTSVTSLGTDKLKPREFLDKDLSIKQNNTAPQILIFHTHSQEDFVDTVEGDTSTTIVGVGDYLTELLQNKYGYNVIHDKSIYDYVDGKLDRSKAYTYATEGIEKILKENPTIEVVIDLHRDGVGENTHLVTEVNGKQTAQIMFFNGVSYSNVNGDITYLQNPYRDDNLAMSLQMQLIGNAYYPGFLRRIYINAYRYCLHERGKSMLIEAGAQTNTVGEVKNAMEPLSDILDKLLKGEKMY